jgi:hypothetical protein
MAQDFLRPSKVPSSDLSKRKVEDGMFRNPPTYSDFGGFTSADKSKFQNNKMTLERSGPTSVKGRPI